MLSELVLCLPRDHDVQCHDVGYFSSPKILRPLSGATVAANFVQVRCGHVPDLNNGGVSKSLKGLQLLRGELAIGGTVTLLALSLRPC